MNSINDKFPAYIRSLSIWLCCVLLGVWCSVAIAPKLYAQTATVSGRVIDKVNNQGLPGATVRVKGSRLGTVTQRDGSYSLTGLTAGQSVTLVVKSIGYKEAQKTVTVGDGAVVNITMEQSVLDLEDVVVTGLAVDVKQKEVGTSRSAVNTQIAELPGTTAEDVLIGRVAGVETYSSDGAPGGGFRFRIRGGNSILSASEPLVIVDGVFLDNSNRNTTTGSNTGSASFGASNGTRGLLAINPEDIESMEILKGAAAASLYGSRASSGVIVITTKKGGTGSLSVDYNLDAGITEVHRGVLQQKTAWSADEIRAWRDSINAILTAVQRPLAYTDAELAKWQSNPRTDWMLAPFQTGSFVRHTVTLRGGNKDFGYYGSFGSQFTEGHQKGTNFGAQGLRIGFNSSALENLEVRANIDLSFDTRRMLPGGSPGFFVPNRWAQESLAMPFMTLSDIRNPLLAGGLRTSQGVPSPDAYTGLRRENNALRVLGTVNLAYKILENLRLDVNTGIDETRTAGKMLYPFGLISLFPQGRLDIDEERIRQFTFTAALNHAWQVSDDISVKSTLGMQYDDNRRDYSYRRYQNRSVLAAEDKPNSYSLQQSWFDAAALVRTLGIYANVLIGIQDKLFINLGGRMDRGTAFKEQFFFYPRANVSYQITPDIRARAAFGQSGTQPPPYLVNPLFTLDGLGYDGSQGALSLRTPGNLNLRPETQTEIEGGIDATLLDGRITVELTYFNKSFADLLLRVPINPATNNGFTTDIRNAGTMTNTGFEFAIGADVIKDDNVRWNVGINGATLVNTVNKLFVTTTQGSTPEILDGVINAPLPVARIREGYPVGGFWGVSPESPTTPVYLGTPWAPLDINLTTSLDASGFFARVLVGGKFGAKRLNATERDLVNPSVRMHTTYWNLPAGTPRDPAGMNTLNALFNNTAHWVQDASFLKIRQVTLGYTLPSEWLENFVVKKVTISFTGANLLTFTNYRGGYDVESETSGFGLTNGWVRNQDAWEAGIPRSYTLSLTVGL
jgi:TonB-linked SusC/RagA family outer membrane protein